MNNQIFELAKQADLIQWDTLPSGAKTPNHESVVKAKNFAQLILKECMAISINFENRSHSNNAAQQIAKHFGIS